MTVRFSPEAEEDFAALIGYLAERNPTAAAELGRDQLGMLSERKRQRSL